jgi:para-aminobenzoate synthetase / 4-amino-4-deoxychorismate lyase
MTISAPLFDGPLPDPAQGVFETTLVTGGRPVALDAHLARLGASLTALYGLAVPGGARAQVEQAAAGVELGRLRLTVGSDGEPSVRVADVDPALVFPSNGISVALVAVPGGIGAHKWADRRLLEQAEAQVGPAVPLVVDADDGAALESSRGSLFVVREGVLVTPPADGRLLPGITRAQAIDVIRGLGVELREEAVDLAAADEVFMTGAVRGVEPVARCAGVAEWDSGELTARVAAELRAIWLS